VFVNAKFRMLLDSEGMEMIFCRNPDVKCSIVERFNRTLKSKLYKWFTRSKNVSTCTCWTISSRATTTRCTRARGRPHYW
jgi:hypothetical protein